MMRKEFKRMEYPFAPRKPEITKLEHGGQTLNHYLWLEKTTTEDVKKFLRDQTEATTSFLKSSPDLSPVKNILKGIANQRKVSCPMEDVGGRLYFSMNEGGNDLDSIYVQDRIKGKPRLFLSPMDVKPITCNGNFSTSFVLRMYNVSPDGNILAYAFSRCKDSRRFYVRFKTTRTGKDYPETIAKIYDSDISWTKDSKGIVYTAYFKGDTGEGELSGFKVLFHRIGTNQVNDLIYVEFPGKPFTSLQAQISDCGEMIFLHAQEQEHGDGEFTYFLYGDLKPCIADDYGTTPLLFQLLEGNGLEIRPIANINGATYFHTNCRAHKFRIMSTVLLQNKSTKGLWETIIPEHPRKLLDWAVYVGRNMMVVCYIKDSTHSLELYTINGVPLYRFPLPKGTITDFSGSRYSRRFFFTFSSFLIPDCVRYIEIPFAPTNCYKKVHCGFKCKKLKYFHKELSSQLDTSKYCMRQRFCVNQKDGTPIPIFLIHKKHLKMNGRSPCIIYGQGCFGIQVMPSFCISKLAFVKCFDGIIAIVGVRGGGEYGKQWCQDGRGRKKQQAYDDFIAASEFLIKLGYTSTDKLILEGELFGGNLAAACMLQRPDLYATIIIHDGLLDLLRFHLFPESKSYLAEFGNPETIHEFDILKKISPLHNVLNENTVRRTPGVMLVVHNEPTLAHPSNSYKFIAELQHSLVSKSSERNPFLLYIPSGIDDSFGETVTSSKVEERMAIFAFLITSLGLKTKFSPFSKTTKYSVM